VVLGYYPYWVANRFPPTAIDFKSFTHICHAFLMSDKDGKLVVDEGSVPSLALTEAAHKAGVKVLLSLGGANSNAYFNAQSQAAQDAFVKGTLEWVEKYGYDGLDLDWEHPESAENTASYLVMAKNLRKGLAALGKKTGKTYLFTAAVPEGDWYGKWYDGPALLELMDFLNIMTYDYAGPWHQVATHNAPLKASPRDPYGGAVSKALDYWTLKKGWPKERLNLGLPCYGRGADVSAPYAALVKGAPRSKVEYLDYKDIPALIEAGWTRSWEAEVQAPWLSSPGKTAVLAYDDPESMALKAAWARASGMGGIFFWDINADRFDDGSSPLVAAARKAFLGQ
jgi:chitinase